MSYKYQNNYCIFLNMYPRVSQSILGLRMSKTTEVVASTSTALPSAVGRGSQSGLGRAPASGWTECQAAGPSASPYLTGCGHFPKSHLHPHTMQHIRSVTPELNLCNWIYRKSLFTHEFAEKHSVTGHVRP